MRSYLLVDDNVDFAENLAEILEDAGARAVTARSGPEAIEKARGERFDALVSDMRMPVMNGAELVHAIRRVDADLPAVVITAFTNDQDLEAARHEGLLAVLPKPVPLARLIDMLARARRGGLVALVEDDPAMSDNLQEALRDEGFATVTAASVLETARIGDVSPFCALVDLRLPGGPDGAAMQQLATRYPGLPMILITAHSLVPPPVAPVATFAKPFDTAALLAEVKRLHEEAARAR